MLGDAYTLKCVGNYVVLYCVVGSVMDVRRFVYDPSDWHTTI